MRNRLLLIVVCIFIIALSCGITYSSWVYNSNVDISNNIGFTVPTWDFVTDTGFATYANVISYSYLTPSQETSITCGSPEAVRFTNEAGTSTKDHIMCFCFDRDYTVGEIKVQKVSFDYYHIAKRQQQGKGFPKLQLLNNAKQIIIHLLHFELCTLHFVFYPLQDWNKNARMYLSEGLYIKNGRNMPF